MRLRGPGLTVTHDRLTVGSGDEIDAAIWLIAFDDHHDVAIERGENRERTLRYHQVVRELTRLGYWHGRAIELELPLAALGAAGRDGAAILVQRLSDGAVLATCARPIAAKLRLAICQPSTTFGPLPAARASASLSTPSRE